ncbi:MAG: N-acetylmuramoyl-L-alanine amidase [Bryobacteraceae bacterium]
MGKPSAPRGEASSPAVWLVEQNADFELYSNGLRVERGWCVPGRPRSPRWLPRVPAARHDRPPDPAGIVFHASENDPPPFDPEFNAQLKKQGASLLSWVRRHSLYHYVVDRFGRVFRMLEDSDRANHAGHSVWADERWVYLDLNESFLAVCFEASTEQLQGEALTPAQVRSGRLLVEMLRTRHRLAPGNCVTHAQVSVNPANGRIGYHTDWAGGFPFSELGLPDNYRQLLPALLFFGFHADSSYLRRAGPQLQEAVHATEEELLRQARRLGMPGAEYRRELAAGYRQAMRTLAGM